MLVLSRQNILKPDVYIFFLIDECSNDSKQVFFGHSGLVEIFIINLISQLELDIFFNQYVLVFLHICYYSKKCQSFCVFYIKIIGNSIVYEADT